MKLNILTPEGKVFSDDVFGVQLPGVDGLLEVLDKHAPLVSALKEGTVKVVGDKNYRAVASFSVKSGFVEVLNNNTTVLVEGATQL